MNRTRSRWESKEFFEVGRFFYTFHNKSSISKKSFDMDIAALKLIKKLCNRSRYSIGSYLFIKRVAGKHANKKKFLYPYFLEHVSKCQIDFIMLIIEPDFGCFDVRSRYFLQMIEYFCFFSLYLAGICEPCLYELFKS